ncbi:MAG: UDP-N-acetylmuramate dehydrogenase [Blastocatellia bacterium]
MPVHKLIQQNVPLAPLTTLRIGGPARFFAEAESEEDLFAAFSFAEDRREPIFILGGGSNVLVADEGFPGLALRVAIKGVSWSSQGDQVVIAVGAGEDWDDLVRQCVERNLAGVECLSGIPGSVGGTPVQNVGAYGQEVSETIISVRVFDRSAGRIVELSNAECRFSYRASVFNTIARDRYVVTVVTYSLKPHGEPALRYPDVKNFFAGATGSPSLRETREAVRTIRARKAMLITPEDPDCRSAGSFFKNPVVPLETFARIEAVAKERNLLRADERAPQFSASDGKVKVPAAWLIERSGFQKGYSRGRVGISSKHTLAIVNRGGATAREVIGLMKEIQERVAERFGVALTPEPVFVGFDLP